MKKYDRQRLILSLIEHHDIETQEQLASLLKEHGVEATQATISRDIKELRITKVQTPDGLYKYTVLDTMHDSLNERLNEIFKSAVLSLKINRDMIIVKTISGDRQCINRSDQLVSNFESSQRHRTFYF